MKVPLTRRSVRKAARRWCAGARAGVVANGGGRGRRSERAHAARSGSLATWPRARPGFWIVPRRRVDPAPHAGGARRGDRAAAQVADDRRGDRVLSGDGALDRLGRLLRSGSASSRGWSRPSRPTATSAAMPASWCTSTSKARRIPGAGHRVTQGDVHTQPPPGAPARPASRLGVRARLRRRRHPPGLRRGPRRREGDHRGRVSQARDRLLRRHGITSNA